MPAYILRFDDFELDPAAFELRRAGRVVRLEHIPLTLLFFLVEHRGCLVTREEILERVWGKDVFLDADNAINTAVSKIRLALKDNPEKPRFLHTVPAMGYRFDAQIVEPTAAAAPVAALPTTQPGDTAADQQQRGWVRLWVALAAVLLLIVLVARPYFSRHSRLSSGKVMLVVVPFVNMNDDPPQDYFADGMTEEMISQLGSLDPAHLGVIARTSAMQYKGAHKDAAQISRELGVNYLLEGSVRREGNRVRVTAQLIQSGDQTHLWADSFDRDLNDILKLQSDVARAIASKIQLTLSQQTEKRLASTPPVNAEAHEAYLQGLQAGNLRSKESSERSIAEFQRAIAIDPGYALAYAGLARTYSLAPVSGTLTSLEAMPKAREAAMRALALDDSLAEGHCALAYVKAHFEYDWPAADREFRRALELNPSYAYGHFFYSNSYLSPNGRHDEAIAEIKQAIGFDPFSSPIQSFLGRTLLWARRYDEALAQLQKSSQLFPNVAIDHERLAHLYTYLGKFEDAIAEETKARLLSGEDPKLAIRKEDELRQAFAAQGSRGYWLKLLKLSHETNNPPEAYSTTYGFAIIYSRLGDKEQAFASLEQAYAERQGAMTELGVEPAFDPLHSDPRFQSLLFRVGLSH